MRSVFYLVVTIILFSCHKKSENVCLSCNLTTNEFPYIPYDTFGVSGLFIERKYIDVPSQQINYNSFAYFGDAMRSKDAIVSAGLVSLQYSSKLGYHSNNGAGTISYNDTLAAWVVKGSKPFSFEDKAQMPYYAYFDEAYHIIPSVIDIHHPWILRLDSMRGGDTLVVTFTSTDGLINVRRCFSATDSVNIDTAAFITSYASNFVTVSLLKHQVQMIDGYKYMFVKQLDRSELVALQ